jgi:hypothetical protein
MKFRILLGAAMVAASTGVATGLLGTAGIASAAPSRSAPYTCSGGEVNFADPPLSTYAPDIPSGTYSSLTIEGVCEPAPNAVITVVGNITVAPGGVLDAQGNPSTITVGHQVIAEPGSFLALGCLPHPPGHFYGHPCGTSLVGNPLDGIDPATARSQITVNGNLTADGANTVVLNGITVMGNVALTGGGGPIPWAIKLNTIGGNIIVSGVTPDWVGLVKNTIGGNANLSNITITDPTDPTPTVQIALNTVGKNLNCSKIGPYLSGGAIPGEVNTVGGKATGQCQNLQSGPVT